MERTDLPDERLGGELDHEGAARVQGGARPGVGDRLGHQVPRRARAVRRQPEQPARRRRRGPPLLPVYQLQEGAAQSSGTNVVLQLRRLKKLSERRTTNGTPRLLHRHASIAASCTRDAPETPAAWQKHSKMRFL